MILYLASLPFYMGVSLSGGWFPFGPQPLGIEGRDHGDNCWCGMFIDIMFMDIIFIDMIFIDMIFIDILFIDIVFIDTILIDITFIDIISRLLAILYVCILLRGLVPLRVPTARDCGKRSWR